MRSRNQQTDQQGTLRLLYLHISGCKQTTQYLSKLHFELLIVQAFYFERDDVDLKGFAKFFRDSAKEEFEHAEKFMKYQTERGGRIVLQDIKRPDKNEWGTGLDAMETALALEKTVNQALLDLKTTSDEHGDHQVIIYMWDRVQKNSASGSFSNVVRRAN